VANNPVPPRRVVVGNGADGKSKVIADSLNPHQHGRGGGSTIFFNEIWTFEDCPIDLTHHHDGGDRAMSHSPPANGAHFRLIQSYKEDASIIERSSADDHFETMNVTGLSEKMDSDRHWNMHRTRTVDYGVVTEGERLHVLPDDDFVMHTGDVIVQLGHWHSWDSTRGANNMLFVMIGGDEYNDRGENDQ
jgi:hypothetical protein